MIKENQQLLNRLNALSDGLIIFLMIPVSFWLRYQVLPDARVNMSLQRYMVIGLFYTVVQIGIFFAMGVYRPFRHARLRRKLSEMLVYVQDINGHPLMPTERFGWVRRT